MKKFVTIVLITLLCLQFYPVTADNNPTFKYDGEFSSPQDLLKYLDSNAKTKIFKLKFVGDIQKFYDDYESYANYVDKNSKLVYLFGSRFPKDRVDFNVIKADYYAANEKELIEILKKLKSQKYYKSKIKTKVSADRLAYCLGQASLYGRYSKLVNKDYTVLSLENKRPAPSPIVKKYTISSQEELSKVFSEGIKSFADRIEVRLTKGKLNLNSQSISKIIDDLAYKSTYGTCFGEIPTQYSSNTITFTINYRYGYGIDAQAAMKSLDSKASVILKSIISDKMTEYEKVKAIHDYLVNNVVYDTECAELDINPESRTLFGALLNGRAVCAGYASAMRYLLNKAGVECIYVVGDADTDRGIIPHAWNKVKVDGKYYNVDVTWDDPINDYDKNILRYDYFLISDKELSKNHKWNTAGLPICEVSYGYYLKALPKYESITEALSGLDNKTEIEFVSHSYKKDWWASNEFTQYISTNALWGVKYTYESREIGDYKVVKFSFLK